MTQANLALAANPNSAAALRLLGVPVPDMTPLVTDAQKESMEIFKAKTVAQIVLLKQSHGAKITNIVNEITALEKKADDKRKDLADEVRIDQYATFENNFFPMQKSVNIPTSPSVLAQYPGIDKIPEGWTAPVAAAAASTV